jgi:hypothetical protein
MTNTDITIRGEKTRPRFSQEETDRQFNSPNIDPPFKSTVK